MVFPLGTVLSAAPGLISAAADIIKVIKSRKTIDVNEDNSKEDKRLEEMSNLIEQQALLIEELALNNKNLVLEIRKNRWYSLAAIITAVLAILLAIVF